MKDGLGAATAIPGVLRRRQNFSSSSTLPPPSVPFVLPCFLVDDLLSAFSLFLFVGLCSCPSLQNLIPPPISHITFKMSGVQPVAVYALRVPAGGALIPAVVPEAAAMVSPIDIETKDHLGNDANAM